MKKFAMAALGLSLCVLLCAAFASCAVGLGSNGSTAKAADVTVSFSGPIVNPSSVYACWIESESGANLKNLYVCNSVVGIGKKLTGDALPLWKTVKYPQHTDIDAITGASVQGNVGLSITREIPAGFPSRVRVCFEIDRSLNSNANFGDRPSMIFRSAVIDLNNPAASPYALSPYAWMANGTQTGTYSQKPTVAIPGFAPYALMTDLSWIADTDDMVSALSASVTKK